MRKKGNLPHAATLALTWDLLSGRFTKFLCEEHSKDVCPQPHYVSKLIGYCQRVTGVTEED
jgi:hypothetical protein